MMVSSKDIWSPSGHANFELFASKLPEQGTLLEIGSCVGKSTVAWAEAFEKQNKKWHIHTIDLFWGIDTYIPNAEWFKLYKASGTEIRSLTGEEMLNEFKENIKGRDNISWEQVEFNNEYVCPVRPTASFFDANHNYDAVTTFLDKYGELDYIFIDDDTKDFPGTQKAIDDFLLKFPREVIRGKVCSILQK